MSTTTSVARPAPPGTTGLVNWVQRHPLVAYFILAFAGAWIFITPILLSQQAWGLITLPEPLLLILFLLSTFAGPAPAAFLVTGITEGKDGVKQLLRRMMQWRVGLGWYLLVIIGYRVLFLAGLLVALGPAPLTTLVQNWPLIFTAYLPLIPFGSVYPGLGEEPGWRGFALPRLQGRYGPLSTVKGPSPMKTQTHAVSATGLLSTALQHPWVRMNSSHRPPGSIWINCRSNPKISNADPPRIVAYPTRPQPATSRGTRLTRQNMAHSSKPAIPTKIMAML
jgi:membrane protease YdiL (CAAX protease family)